MNSPRFLFVLVEPPKLESQGDGRRLALEVIRQTRDAGMKACSAHPWDRRPRRQQFGALVAALAELERAGTSQARAAFGSVLTDLLGRLLAGTSIPEEVEYRERKNLYMRFRGEAPKTSPHPASPTKQPAAAPKRSAIGGTKEVDWSALNPGRRMRT